MAGDIDGPRVILGADVSAVETELNKVSGKFEELGSKAKQTFSKIGKDIDLSNVSRQIDNIAGKMQNLGAGLSLVAVPFEAFGVLAVNAFAEFEQNIGKINTLLPTATKSQIDAIGDNLIEFSRQYGADVNTATQAYYDALSAGIQQTDVMPFLETAQKAGVAGMSDVSVAVDGLTSVLNAYQMDTSKASDVSDTMFKTVELGKIEFDELANSIGKVTPTASSFKVGFQDVGAAISQITSLGVSPEETMTGLKNLIKDLGTSGSDLNVKFKQLSGQGFTEFMKSGGSLVEVIKMLRDYSQKTGTSFFNMTKSFESANTLAMLGGDAFDNYAGFLDKIQGAAGATETAYSKMSGTLTFEVNELKSQLQTMTIEIGEALAPAVKDFTSWLTDNSDEIKDFAVKIAENAVPAIEKLFKILEGAMDLFNKLSPDTKSLLATVLGVGIGGAALGGPVLFTAGTALSGVSGLVGLLAKLTVPTAVVGDIGAIGTAAEAAAGASGVGGLTTALAAIGGGPVLVGLAAVTLGVAAWTTDFMGVRTTVLGAADNIFAGFSNAVDTGLEIAQRGGNAVSEAFYGALSQGYDYESPLLGNLQTIFTEATDLSGISGRAAAANYVEQWNEAISTGKLKAPDIPDSSTPIASLSGGNQNIPVDWSEIERQKEYQKNIGAYTTNLTFVGVGNLTSTDANALEFKQSTEKVSQAFSKLPPAINTVVDNITKAGTTTSPETSPAAALLAKERGLQLADAQKMLDSSALLKAKYEEQAKSQTANTAATQSGETAVKKFTDAVNTATQSANTQAVVANTTASTQTPSWYKSGDWDASSNAAAKAGIDITTALTQFNQLESEKKTAVSDNTAAVNRQTSSIDSSTKAAEAVTDAYKKYTGSGVSPGTATTTTAPSNLQDLRTAYAQASGIARDIVNKLTPEELVRNLALYGISLDTTNAKMGQSVETLSYVADSVDKLSAGDAFTNIQNTFRDLKSQFESGAITQDQYLNGLRKASAETDTLSRSTNILKGTQKDTVLQFERDIKESLRRISAGTYGNEPIKSIGSSITGLSGSSAATTQVTESVTALNRALADGKITVDEVKSVWDELNKSQGLTGKYTQDTATKTESLVESIGKLRIVQDEYAADMADGTLSAEGASKMQKQLTDINKLLGDAGISASQGLDGLPGALQTLSQYAQNAITTITNSIAAANTAISNATNSPTTGQTGGTTPSFASGGEVTRTGPATVHQGEYVLNRNDVNRLMRVQQPGQIVSPSLHFDMRGATIDKDTSRDLPKLIARSVTKSLGRLGV